MKDISGELLYILVFAVIILGPYLLQWLRRGKEPLADETQTDAPQQGQGEQAMEAVSAAGEPPAPATPARPESADLPRTPAAPEHALTPAPGRFSRRSLFGGKQRMQDAIVASVILGSCRALLPHDEGR